MMQPPPGFEIIQDGPPKPPPGFELEASKPHATGYLSNLKNMFLEGTDQFVGGMDDLTGALRSAASGSGPDARPKEIGDLVRGFGNTVAGGLGAVYSPLNAALRTYVGQPVEDATGVPKEIPELVVGLAGPSAVTRGARAIGRSVASKPTGEQIEAAAVAGFQSPAVRGLEVRPAPVQSWTQTLRGDLTQSGLDDIRAPATWRTLQRLDNMPAGGSVTGNNLSSLRQSLANTAKERGPDFQPTQDAAAATQAIRSLDNMIGGVRPRDVVSGNPAEAQAVWNEARGNYAQFAKIRSADRRQVQAEGNTGSAHSGLNYDNSIRQRMRDIATGPAGRGFTGPGEREAVERVVHGSPERNLLRIASAIMGGGGGLGALASGGTAGLGGMGWAGAAVPAAGMGLRVGQNMMTSRDMDRLNSVLRANSPLASQAGGGRQDMARALMGADLPPWAQNAIAAQLLSRPPPFAGK